MSTDHAYVMYDPGSGDPKLFVMATADYPEPRERFTEERRAYEGLHTAPRPVDPAYLPKEFRLDGKRKIPPIFVTWNGFVVVDGAMRAAIEALEPDMHQFIPVSMIHKSGEREPRDFFVLNVHRQVPAVALEKLSAVEEQRRDGGMQISLPTEARFHMKLRRDRLDEAGHMFVDTRSRSLANHIFISSEMLATIKAAKGRLHTLWSCEII